MSIVTDRLRSMRLLPEFLRQFFQPLRHPVLLDVLERLLVHARSAPVSQATLPGRLQHILPVHLVVQGIEAVLRFSLRFGMQRRPQLLNRFGSG